MAVLERGRTEADDSATDNSITYKARNLTPKFSEDEPDDSGFKETAVAMGEGQQLLLHH